MLESSSLTVEPEHTVGEVVRYRYRRMSLIPLLQILSSKQCMCRLEMEQEQICVVYTRLCRMQQLNATVWLCALSSTFNARRRSVNAAI